MSARAGTPLSQIEVELASRGQMLPFEPIDLGPALGTDAGLQTIGAIFVANISGSRRISAGAARDYLLGARGVNGRAEIFKSGGRVMKNVTGYDVARGLSGSWGTLAVFSEVTFKVLPLPDDVATLVYPDLTDDLAVELMSLALTQPYEVSGTVHLSPMLASRLKHKGLSKGARSLTAIRLENFTRSIAYRKQKLRELLSVYGAPLELELESSLEFWGEVPERHASLAHLDDSQRGGVPGGVRAQAHAGGGVLRLVGRSRLARDAGFGGCRQRRRSPRCRHSRRACHADPRGRDRAPVRRGVPAARARGGPHHARHQERVRSHASAQSWAHVRHDVMVLSGLSRPSQKEQRCRPTLRPSSLPFRAWPKRTGS
jgi:FAD/FMN-containing dehydrogenase